MHVGERIKSARSLKGWSQARLAEEINTAQTTVSSWERGRTEPTREDVARVADVLGVSLAQIELDVRGETVNSCPVVGFVGAGSTMTLFAEGQGPFDYVDAPPDAREETVAAEIRGDSLGAFFNHWLVFYDDVHSPVTPAQLGELCVVGLEDGRVLVKKVAQGSRPDVYHLISQFEEPIFDATVVWAAKVNSMRPR